MHSPIPATSRSKVPWNKGRLIGQKRPLKPKEVWAIRAWLQLKGRKRDLALFNLAIDSKLRGCDLVRPKFEDIYAAGRVRERGTVIQKKTGRPVQFEITEQTRTAVERLVVRTRAREAGFSVSEPVPSAAASLDPAICTDSPCLDCECWARHFGVRDTLDAADEGGANL